MEPVTFWAIHNDKWTKIELVEDEDVEFVEGGPTDEGWRRLYTTYSLDGDRIICEQLSEAMDCDGRIDHYWKGFAKIDSLKRKKGGRYIYPKWETEESSQRDYEAEKAGY